MAEQRKDMADRWRAMMVEIRAAVGTDYAMYAVANRELLDLALSRSVGTATGLVSEKLKPRAPVS